MGQKVRFDDARRQLDLALGEPLSAPALAGAEVGARPDGAAADDGSTGAPASPLRPPRPGYSPVESFGALTRLGVGATLLGLDGLAWRAALWEAASGLNSQRQPGGPAQPASQRPAPDDRIRHALVGWIFETQERLQPTGDPAVWLRAVSGHVVGTLSTVVREALPNVSLGLGERRADRAEAEVARWIARGQAEDERSQAFAMVALDDLVNLTISYLARQRGVQDALAYLVRSSGMDDAIRQITSSAAMDDAIRQIVRTQAMEDAVRYLVGTEAMADAIEILARSPALVALIQTQSTSLAGEVFEEVREHGVSGDRLLEGLARRLLRRPPRATLPPEEQQLAPASPDQTG
jgi:hypothetical protein